jgi:hypothetical protein
LLWRIGLTLAIAISALTALARSTVTPAHASPASFLYTGTEETYVVPPGASSLTITANGGAGADNGCLPDGFGGYGGTVTATVPVKQGETLYVDIGQNARGAAGGAVGPKPSYGGNAGTAGAGGGGCGPGGGGGGYSVIETCSLIDPACYARFYTASEPRMIVAGGGGGAGSFDGCSGGNGSAGVGGSGGSGKSGLAFCNGGGGGGAGTGSSGQNTGDDKGGSGATQAAVGAGGAGDLTANGAAGGTQTSGRAGDSGGNGYSSDPQSQDYGGGGGAGFYGGGGGGSDLFDSVFGAGGGAGSSWAVPGSTDVTYGNDTTRTPEVVITPLFGDATISAQPATFTATEGQSFTETVASFTDPDASATTGEYLASIDWGDGSPLDSAAAIAESEGVFFVSGTHTYAEEGEHSVTVTVTDSDNTSNAAAAASTALVDDAPLAAGPACPSGSLQVYNGPVVGFTDVAGPSGTLSDFSATIDWGDGSSTSAGTVSGPDGGPYAVAGSHTYSSTGSFTITTTVTDVGGAPPVKASCAVLVFAFAPGRGSFVIGDKESAVGTAVTFWGAQWSRMNAMSGGSAPHAFKGFARPPITPTCGSTWSAGPGNSTPPPAGPLPTYMALIAASSVSKSGSSISGDTSHIVIVHTDGGYAPDPGHAGTGTVVGTVC